MNIELKSPVSHDLIAELKKGHYFVFHDFTQKQFYYDAIRQIIFDGIEKIEGLECRQIVQAKGLSMMHKYFPVDKLIYLDVFIREHIQQLIVKMAYSFCKYDLNLSSVFLISSEDFLVKISYPFEIARKSKITYQQYAQYINKRLAPSKPFKLRNSLINIKANVKKLLKKSKIAVGYHDNYPYAASVFGPHLDSWYGAPLDGINLWWSIEGASKDNSMILYPDTFGEYIKHEKEFGYIPPGVTLTKPHKVEIADGGVLVFNSDLLHGSHLNISDVTRITIAPRITLDKPKFNCEVSDRDFRGWYSSEDIARGDFGKLIKFPMKDNWGTLYEGRQKPRTEKRISITLDSSLAEAMPITLCSSDTLSIGEKMLVNLKNESIVVLRTPTSLQAVSAICPHLKINLIDGFHDERQIYCPGHGVAFSLTDGSSKCPLLKLQVYKVYDHKGKIFIEKAISRIGCLSGQQAIQHNSDLKIDGEMAETTLIQ